MISRRLRVGIQALGAALSLVMRGMSMHPGAEVIRETSETARPNPSKPYKPRRLKLDPIHKMARVLYKMKKRDPKFVRQQKIRSKLYRRKNKQLLERRADFVKKARDRMGLED